MNRLQPIFDIAQICSLKGLNQAVLCPGSRCAPLTLAFSRHPKITTRIFSDERSAAFIALGMARQTRTPSILVCTSGSAAYNFAPAVAEAFFQHTPLLIFTADRPAEWIDQLDGQTIRQANLYGNHVKGSFDLPQEYDHPDAQWHINRIVNEAINLSIEFPGGPVHVNVPFREPFYPAKGEKIHFSDGIRIIDAPELKLHVPESDQTTRSKKIGDFTKVLIAGGQGSTDEKLSKALERFSKSQYATVVGDIISNLHGLPQTVRHADVFLGQSGESVKKTLQPELLITFGQSVISKNLKQFLRHYKPQEHWHIQPAGAVADTFQTLTKIIRCSPTDFFEAASSQKKLTSFEVQKRENYTRLWEAEEHRTLRSRESFFSSATLSEFHLTCQIMSALPARCNLHLANSMSVRYANFIGLEAEKKGVHVFSNRGTSGIDGCTSTAVGHALTSEVPNVLITGDMAFFYDRNAFWHNYPFPNLHIVVLNNHGGVIFKMIEGPGTLPEADEYFITRQPLSANKLAAEFGMDYLTLDSAKKMKSVIGNFLEFDGKPKILEIESDSNSSKKTFDEFKKAIRKGYES